MSQKDIVGEWSVGAENLVFDMKGLFADMYQWLGERGYDFLEQDHLETMQDEGFRRIEITVSADRKANEYVKQVMDISINMKIKDVEIKEKEKQKGSIKIEIQSWLKKDYAGEWESPISRFLREVYDKFMYRSKLASFENELSDETKKLIYEIKAFLKLQKRIS